MVNEFKNLTAEEQEMLLKAPVLVSVQAATRNHEISEAQKADAFKLAHLKTFTAAPQLAAYYEEVNQRFKVNFEAAIKKYAPFEDKTRRAQERKRINLSVSHSFLLTAERRSRNPISRLIF
jgi:hypothetical protein